MNQPIASRGAQRQSSPVSARLQHWLQHHRREAGASLSRLARAPFSTLMTLLVMTIAFALPLGLGLLLDDARQVVSGWDGEARLSVYLKDGVAGDQQQVLLAQTRKLADVASVRLITPDQALAEFKQHSGYGPALDQLGENPLPAVLEIFPRDSTDSQAMTQLRDTLAKWPEVSLAEVDIAWVQRLREILEIGDRLLMALGGALLLGGLLVVGNTIRLSIESRRDEIRVISLLGATHPFVRRPFIYMGLWCGLISGILSLASVCLFTSWLNVPVTALAHLYGSTFALEYPDLRTSACMLAGACVLGWLGAWVAVSRHLRELEP